MIGQLLNSLNRNNKRNKFVLSFLEYQKRLGLVEIFIMDQNCFFDFLEELCWREDLLYFILFYFLTDPLFLGMNELWSSSTTKTCINLNVQSKLIENVQKQFAWEVLTTFIHIKALIFSYKSGLLYLGSSWLHNFASRSLM